MFILGAHQPNYLPWIGYFHKMAKTDRFVLADDVQYSTQGYTNRARIKTGNGPQWLSVPVLTSGKGLQDIRDLRIDRTRNWRQKHWKTISVTYSSAPYFERYADFFERMYQKDWIFLADLNIYAIHFLKNALSIDTLLQLSSELGIRHQRSTERIISMAGKTGSSAYISGNGGSLSYLCRDAFAKANLKLIFNGFHHPKYPQQHGSFLPTLSVIDILFNCGETAKNYLCETQLMEEILEEQ